MEKTQNFADFSLEPKFNEIFLQSSAFIIFI